MLFYLLQQEQGRSWTRYGLLVLSYLFSVKFALELSQRYALLFQDTFARPVIAGAITAFFVLFVLISFRKINLSCFPGLAWWGSLTYPLYLLHEDIGFIIFHRLQHVANKYVLVGGTLLLVLVAARAIHVFIEKPMSKLLGAQVRKWLEQLDARRPSFVASATQVKWTRATAACCKNTE